MTLDPVQAEVTRIALAAAGHDFALAGGNALIAHGVLSRPTADVDLFSPQAAGAAQVAEAVRAALTSAGYQVDLIAGLDDGNQDFARFRVTQGAHSVLLDLARDWRWTASPTPSSTRTASARNRPVSSATRSMTGPGPPTTMTRESGCTRQYTPPPGRRRM